jgi:hypothetical protein
MRTRVRHSKELKKVAVQKYFSRENRSLEDLSLETGISKSTLWREVQKYKEYANSSDMKDTQKRPQDWSPNDKIRAFFDYENIAVEQQGEFLRGKGLHSNHILEWKKLCISVLSKKNDSVHRGELNEANKKIKELEYDLTRKEKALAEAAALLILKKKADLIWGSEV